MHAKGKIVENKNFVSILDRQKNVFFLDQQNEYQVMWIPEGEPLPQLMLGPRFLWCKSQDHPKNKQVSNYSSLIKTIIAGRLVKKLGVIVDYVAPLIYLPLKSNMLPVTCLA